MVAPTSIRAPLKVGRVIVAFSWNIEFAWSALFIMGDVPASYDPVGILRPVDLCLWRGDLPPMPPLGFRVRQPSARNIDIAMR